MGKMFTPVYTISNKALNEIAEIESIRTNVAGSRILPERTVELHYRATVEQVHSSTSIEGNPLTLKQVDSVLKGRGLTRHAYAETEVRNYKDALDFIDKRKRDSKPLEYDDLLTLHRLAMRGLLADEKTGALRKGMVYIVDQDDKVKYTGPQARYVQKKLEGLVAWQKTAIGSVHPCLAAAILHYQLATIHPFADGNGRTARLATMLYLGICGYDFNGSIVLDSYYAQERGEYYIALHECQGERYREGNDLTPWVDYFITGFLSSAKILWAEVAIMAAFQQPLAQKQINRDDADILNYACQFGSISLSEAEGILPGMSRRTLQRRLAVLVESGYLVKTGAARSVRYDWIQGK
ncbi:MAG: Fic family protein [Clostridiales bacterium]|nr:Fic family protein [Clostridiales bacterium]